jgi:hypothetical protein
MYEDVWEGVDPADIEQLIELLSDPDFLQDQIVLLQQFMYENGHTREEFLAWKSEYLKRELH